MEKVLVSLLRLFCVYYQKRFLKIPSFFLVIRVSDTLKLLNEHKSRNKSIAIGLYESPS